MKQLDIRKYIFDINGAYQLLLQFNAGKTFSDYSTDPMLRSAVERQFEIIGETLVQALRLDPSLSSRMNYPAAELRGIQLKKNSPPPLGGRIKVGVMRRSFPPHPDPLPPGEREVK